MPLLNLLANVGRQPADRALGRDYASLNPPEFERSREDARAVSRGEKGSGRPLFFETCANPSCGSGWLHLWRSRSAPLFEGGWSCSPSCTHALLAEAVRRELEGRLSGAESHRHRVPLGLLMLEQGWITTGQLRQALEAQKAGGGGRLGHWMVRHLGVREELVTRALGLQWSCPVLPIDFHDAEGLSALIPRLFVDAFGALPLRVAAGKLLYLGFEDRLDPVLALAVERMTGMRVECGLVRGSEFRAAHTRALQVAYPTVRLIEASTEQAAIEAMAAAVERARATDARLVRVHDCLWLRIWRRRQLQPVPALASVEDLICSMGAQ